MKRSTTALLILILALAGTSALGHGIPLGLITSGGTPYSMVPDSDAPFLVYNTFPPAGFYNMFLGRFGATATTDAVLFPGDPASYLSGSGFVEAVNTLDAWPAIASAHYTIVTPLMFSDGGAAVQASAGTMLRTRNTHAGDPLFPGATAGGVDITGTSGVLTSPGVSMGDSHELAFRLFLGPGSTQTFGAYGFGYTVTVDFVGGQTLTSPRLIEVFQMRDPTIAGGQNFNDAANAAAQLAASNALYGALVPEPSTFVLAGLGTALVGACGIRGYRRRRVPTSRRARQIRTAARNVLIGVLPGRRTTAPRYRSW
jgi:hypothetical protein